MSRRNRSVQARRRGVLLALLLLALGVGAYVGLGGGSTGRTARTARRPALGAPGGTARAASPAAPPAPVKPPVPHLLVTVPGASRSWRVAARVDGQPAAWVAQRSGVAVMRFEQPLVHLDLHPGLNDGGGTGWAYGSSVNRREIHLLVAAFNGGFKLTYANVGFLLGSHVAVPVKPGLASIVTYTDGTTDIGAWDGGVPDRTKRVFSVLQNQHLLIDQGQPVASVSSCGMACWGETLGGGTSVARSGLGITSGGRLVWAAGEQLTPSGLADVLVAAGAVRAVELDINPFWVAGYLYPHHPSGPSPVPVLPDQHGIAGELLEPNARDFLVVVARR
jgi:hypothetical protein